MYVLSPHELLVRLHTEDPSFLTQTFKLHEGDANPVTGAVFKLNGTYAEYHNTDLWKWLAEARQDHGSS